MRKSAITILAASLAAVSASSLLAQSVQPPSGKTLAATMNIYAFPAAGQAAEQQSQDESACYTWAVQNTGTDPFELSKQAQQQQQQDAANQQAAAQAGKGSAARGAARGAAAGALVGEIADDDAGKGAAIGAAAGAVHGRRKGKAAEQQASSQAAGQAQQAQASAAQQMDGFKKAFSACMESKKYTVKF
jgi:hypothetical protein